MDAFKRAKRWYAWLAQLATDWVKDVDTKAERAEAERAARAEEELLGAVAAAKLHKRLAPPPRQPTQQLPLPSQPPSSRSRRSRSPLNCLTAQD